VTKNSRAFFWPI